MKMKKEYVILIGLIAVLLVFLLLSGRKGRMGYEIPALKSVEAEALDRIELQKGDRTITLQKENGGWILQPQGYPADKDRADKILETVSGLTLTELASEKGDLLRYELDEENRIRVSAFSGPDKTREFEIGKTTPTYRHTFVRIEDNQNVYHARGSFRSEFDYDVDGLRDKVVMKFDSNEVSAAGLVQDDLDVLLTKTLEAAEAPAEEETAEGTEEAETPPAPMEEETWKSEDGRIGNTTEVKNLLSQVSDLRCDSYIENVSKEDYQNPIFQATLKGNKDYVLQIFAKDEDQDKYPALSSESPYPFFLTVYKAESIMKEPAKWLNTE